MCKQEHRYFSFKKTKELLINVTPKYRNISKPLKIRLEMDEMWGRVHCKRTPCWLWHVISHENGDVVAYVLSSREHESLWEVWELLSDTPITMLFREASCIRESGILKQISDLSNKIETETIPIIV